MAFFVWTEDDLKMELFENDDITQIKWFLHLRFFQAQIQNGWWLCCTPSRLIPTGLAWDTKLIEQHWKNYRLYSQTLKLWIGLLFTATSAPGCGVDKFSCNNTRCIPERFVCDLDDDCGDASDEHANCTQPTCRPTEFTCDNQRCVLTEWKCDGDNDCSDLSDERNCCE